MGFFITCPQLLGVGPQVDIVTALGSLGSLVLDYPCRARKLKKPRFSRILKVLRFFKLNIL